MAVQKLSTVKSYNFVNGVRRGTRLRARPAAYWKNERPCFDTPGPSRRTVTLSEPSENGKRSSVQASRRTGKAKRRPTPGPEAARAMLRLEVEDIKEEEKDDDNKLEEEVDELGEDQSDGDGSSRIQTPRRPTSPIMSERAPSVPAAQLKHPRTPALPSHMASTSRLRAASQAAVRTRSKVQPHARVKEEDKDDKVLVPKDEQQNDDVKPPISTPIPAPSSSKKKAAKETSAADRKGKRKAVDVDIDSERDDSQPPRLIKKLRLSKPAAFKGPSERDTFASRIQRSAEHGEIVTPPRPSVRAMNGGLPTPESPLVSIAGRSDNTRTPSHIGSTRYSKAPVPSSTRSVEVGSSRTAYDRYYANDADEEDEDGILRYSPVPVRRYQPSPELGLPPDPPSPSPLQRELSAVSDEKDVLDGRTPSPPAPQPHIVPNAPRIVPAPLPPAFIPSAAPASVLVQAVPPARSPTPHPLPPPDRPTPVFLAWLRPLRLEHRADVFARLGMTALWQMQQVKGLREANREAFFASFLNSGGTVLDLVILRDAVEGLRTEPYYQG